MKIEVLESLKIPGYPYLRTYGGTYKDKVAIGRTRGQVIEKLLDLPKKKRSLSWRIDYR